MNERIQDLLAEISRLREELRIAMKEREARLMAEFGQRSAEFELQMRALQTRLKTNWLRYLIESELRNVLTAPIIYAMIIPFVLLDLCLTIYQLLCFPLYRLPQVKRGNYISIDRHKLPYLNVIEKINCVYCGYANGLIAYTGEIAARTEQYWCPIKHAQKILDSHERFDKFADYGDAQAYRDKLEPLRTEMRNDTDDDSSSK